MLHVYFHNYSIFICTKTVDVGTAINSTSYLTQNTTEIDKIYM